MYLCGTICVWLRTAGCPCSVATTNMCNCSLIMLVLGLQAETWIDGRLQKLEEPSLQHLNNLNEKMKLLQKHQAFEAEILAHQDLITTVNMVTLNAWAVI